MDKKILFIFFTAILGVCYGEAQGSEPTNYDLSRKKIGNNDGGGYGQYNPYPNYPNYPGGSYYPNRPTYPSGPGLYPGTGYPGQYPGGNYPGHNQGVVGPPGAHPGCPLCDSSVYSYCSYKQAHDSCCCENPAYLPYNCRKSSCKSLYANTCEEYNLISSCCCIDVQKNAVDNIVPVN
ncbi:galectin-3 isoform X2 [Hyposmocoma kahamanoa]|uniref:galectin-3 isoform X2 n=1 Tax=Hyposmocoma kahamanoa TaxID=1477025 RepID=UPI000E6D7355|nr:galectin-3 isoform X2 [Hyposmocoma kahamanoa]